MGDDIPTPEDVLRGFNGRARLFPLPNLTMFPHVVQPLHIFEPRYRAMVEDALAADRLIALVLLRPGWEDDYEGNPPVHPVACLGHILADQQLDDGRYNILLRGLCRVRILAEEPAERRFRVARVERMEETTELSDVSETPEAHHELLAAFRAWLPKESELADRLTALLDPTMPFAALTDVIAYTVRLAVEQKQELLEELNVARRAERLLKYLRALPPLDHGSGRSRRFPPDFSEN